MSFCSATLALVVLLSVLSSPTKRTPQSTLAAGYGGCLARHTIEVCSPSKLFWSEVPANKLTKRLQKDLWPVGSPHQRNLALVALMNLNSTVVGSAIKLKYKENTLHRPRLGVPFWIRGPRR